MNTGTCKKSQGYPGSGTASGSDFTSSLSLTSSTQVHTHTHSLSLSAVSVALHCRPSASLIQMLAPARAREAAKQLQLEKQNSLYSQVMLEFDVMKPASLLAPDLSDLLDS